jgi:hypothetical protein
MADFCVQCAKRHNFGINDLAGLSRPEDTEAGLYPVVLCEGCGPCQVDHEGNCVSPDCDEKHGKPLTPKEESECANPAP